jgi:hypothetical protein
MEHGNNRNLTGRLVDFVHDDVRQADDDPFVGSANPTGVAYVRPHSQAIGRVADTGDNFGRRARIVLLDVCVEGLDVALSSPSIANLS